MGNLPLPDNQMDRDLFLGKIQRRISDEEALALGAKIQAAEFEPIFSENGRLVDPGIL